MTSPTIFHDYVGKLGDIVYKAQGKTQKGGVVVYFRPNKSTESNMRIQLQTADEPRCKTPFATSAYDDDGTATRKNLELSLENESLVKFFQEFDEQNIQAAIDHKDWFKKTFTEAQIRNMYYPLLTYDITGKGYSPRLHTKVNTEGKNKVNVLLYTEENGCPEYRPGNESDIQRYSECMVICEASGLWFQSKQFGMSLVCTDVIIFPKAERSEFEFLWGSAPAPTKVGTAPAPTEAHQKNQAPSQATGFLGANNPPSSLSSSVLLMPSSSSSSPTSSSSSSSSSTPGVTLIGKGDSEQPDRKKAKK